jgi:dTDP-4-amino-4,6-dideoxygalactose transaminase|tara:strand:+ start:255 stop:959 length:705 start_codon:yes stop_codon:yes gene_type:complete
MNSKKVKYHSWPIGRPPAAWDRPELEQVRKAGYDWDDPRDIVEIFEKKMALYSGCKYAVAVDSCSSGIFLSLKYHQASGVVTIPNRTYVSVPMQIIHAGCEVNFQKQKWTGIYQLKPYPIYDGAVRFTKNMYVGNNALQVVSFQIKKRLFIGKGGMILTDDYEAYKWLKKASYDGRDLELYYPEDEFEIMGWHMYMTPEDAARGILIMDQLPEKNEDSGCWENYSDLSNKEIFK